MHASLLNLRDLVFGGDLARIPDAVDQCLYDILDQYDHFQMIVFTRLLEMLLDTDMSSKASRTLKIIDLIKFPVKKAMG
ncbi:hypothetical protein J0A71_10g21820 [Encephalitozoon cuniculi]|nr:hypothetical protein J0A71_10g21820 [Encephalitozoon cuniculi]